MSIVLIVDAILDLNVKLIKRFRVIVNLKYRILNKRAQLNYLNFYLIECETLLNLFKLN